MIVDQSLLQIRLRTRPPKHNPITKGLDFTPLEKMQIEWSTGIASETWIPGPTLQEALLMRNPVFVLVMMAFGKFQTALGASYFAKEVEMYIKRNRELYELYKN